MLRQSKLYEGITINKQILENCLITSDDAIFLMKMLCNLNAFEERSGYKVNMSESIAFDIRSSDQIDQVIKSQNLAKRLDINISINDFHTNLLHRKNFLRITYKKFKHF